MERWQVQFSGHILDDGHVGVLGVQGEGYVLIADCGISGWPANVAHAHLIAAAPDMLQALREAIAAYERGSDDDFAALESMRVAIAKAEGPHAA
jgi:hypothetical protein